MRLSARVVVAFVTLWLALAAGARSLPRAKQPRPTRGFKNTDLMTARGFGKRALHPQETRTELGLPMGPADNFLDMLEAPQDRGYYEQVEEKQPESVPVDWFVDELLNNPELARTVVRKFMDTNQDGMLSPYELLRNVY